MKHLTNHLTPIGNVVNTINALWGLDAAAVSRHSAEFTGTAETLQRESGRKILRDYIEEYGLKIRILRGKIRIYPDDVRECCGDVPPSTEPVSEPDLTGLGRVRGGRKRSARSQMKHLKNFIETSIKNP